MKRTVWFIIGGVLLVALLAGGAYMGARLLAQRPQANGPGGGLSLSMAGGKGGAQAVKASVKAAPELPQTPADARGVFVRREDRSVFIGTGQVMVMAQGAPVQTPQAATNYSGPVVEVVINQNTTIYRDTTKPPEALTDNLELQQTVEPGSIDDIGQNSMLQVWGNKTGDRIVAQVVVYSQPMILNAKIGTGN